MSTPSATQTNFFRKFESDACNPPAKQELIKHLDSQQLQISAKNTTYPYFAKKKLCTVMLMTNLVDPDWVLVNCSTTLLHDIVCMEPRKRNKSHLYFFHPDRKMCSPNAIRNRDNCFLFLKYSPSTDNSGQCMSPAEDTTRQNIIQNFRHLFDATSAAFPPIYFNNHSKVLTYEKFYTEYYFLEHGVDDMNLHGVTVSEVKPQDTEVRFHLHSCEDESFVSVLQTCNCLANCVGNNTTDKQNRSCQNSSCQQTTIFDDSNSTKCHPPYYPSHTKTCHLYMIYPRAELQETTQVVNPEVFFCVDGENVSYALMNDLVADCGSSGEDEFHLKSLLKSRETQTCEKPEEIPCRKGHSKCFPIHQVCVFKLNKLNNLTPCRTGGHLMNCTEFECNVMFKCPEYYCVPWSYVCDGKWNCPDGMDEYGKEKCGANQHCQNMFKCGSHYLCLHLTEVCDGVTNCPLKDDEQFCGYNNFVCPVMCNRVLFTLICHETRFWIISSGTFSPFTVGHVTNCLFQSNRNILPFFQQVTILLLKNNSLASVCPAASLLINSWSVDLSVNCISSLSSGCFRNLSNLSTVFLQQNRITEIKHQSFVLLPKLKLINLAVNEIACLAYKGIYGLNLSFLMIHNNSLADSYKHIFKSFFGKIISVTNMDVCCTFPSDALCVPRSPGYIECNNLLNTFVWFVILINLILILSFNMISTLLQKLSLAMSHHTQQYKQAQVFAFLVICLNTTDVSLAVYFLVLVTSENFYHNIWKHKSSATCAFASLVFVHYSFINPMLIAFLTLSRKAVVVNPLHTKFLQLKFVQKLSFASVLVSFVFSGVVEYILIIEQVHSFEMCSPLMDSSQEVLLSKTLVFVVSGLQLVSLLFIIVCDIQLVVSLKNIPDIMTTNRKKRNVNKLLVAQLVVLCASHMLCWVPTSTVHVAALFLAVYPVRLVTFTSAFCTPINAIVNPVVLGLTTARKLVRKIRSDVSVQKQVP